MSTAGATYHAGGRRAWVIWGSAVAVYLIAVFHRTSLSVAGIAAAERFHVSAAQLSTFTFLQLLVYAAMQLPVGVLLDRFGSKRLLTTGLVLMTVGQLGFAFVPSYPLALITRGLVGVGDAMTFVSVLRLAAAWFPPARNPLLTQLTSFAGQVGAMVAAIPMAHVLARFGWSTTYAGAAIAGLLLGAVMYVVVVDAPTPSRSVSAMRMRAVLAGVRQCWTRPGTRLGAWVHFTSLFCPNVVALLWGYPYLVDGQGASTTTAAALLTVMTASSMASGPLVGVMIGRWPAARPAFLTVQVGSTVGSWTLVLVWPGPAPLWALVIMVLVVGTGIPGAMVGFDFARLANPLPRVGTATAIVNAGGFVSTIVVVLGIGLVLDVAGTGGSAHYSPRAFTLAMLVPYAAWALGAVQILRYYRRAQRIRWKHQMT